MVNSANEKANRILQEASKKAKKLAVETDDLKKNTRVFRQRLQVMLESQLEVIKAKEWDNLLDDDNTTNGYEEIEKTVSQLDNSNDSSVNSESDADIVENAVAADHMSETVVIYPDGDQK